MRWKRHIPKIVGTLIVMAVGVLMVYLVHDLLKTPGGPPKKGPQQITLLTPPPPPPPPPPPEPEVKDEVKLEEPPVDDLPKEAADEPPPGDNLGIDAEGGAGDDFGLIGRKGGRGLLDGSGDPASYFASQLQRQIEDVLLAEDAVRRKSYSVIARIWTRPDGHVLRAELAKSTGDSATDASLIAAITKAQAPAQAPPADMPQPIRMRISSRL